MNRMREDARSGRKLGGEDQDRAGRRIVDADNAHRSNCTTFEPVALYAWKADRWRMVGRLAPLDGKIILGVVHRYQKGLKNGEFSVPELVLAYAQENGAKAVVVRKDQTKQMWRVDFEDFMRLTRPRKDGERYLRTARMEPIPYYEFPYAVKEIYLGSSPPKVDRPESGSTPSRGDVSPSRQLCLWEDAA